MPVALQSIMISLRILFAALLRGACADSVATQAGDAGDAGVIAFNDASQTFDSSANDATAGVGCSGDLRNVLDGNGNVIATCADNEGCAGGQCVAACTAAGASKGSLGCDYMVSTPGFDIAVRPPCFAMFVANAWPTDAQLNVDLGGVIYDVTKFGRIAEVGTPETSWAPVPASGVPAGKVAVLFLSPDPKSVFI